MPVVVDPNAAPTFKEKITGAYSNSKALIANAVAVGMLAYVVHGAPDWFANIVHTLVWLYVPVLLLVVTIFLVLSIIISTNKDAMIKNTEPKSRELSQQMSKFSKEIQPKRTAWLSHLFTVAEVVLVYMAGWTVAGAIILILSLIFLMLRKGLRTQIKDIAMAKLGRE